MRRELTMPKLSDSMADAVIVRWLKSAGETFARGEGLMEVETDKATVVYEAEWDGTLASILAPEGATVAVGEPIATLANGDRAEATDPRPAPRPRSATRLRLPPLPSSPRRPPRDRRRPGRTRPRWLDGSRSSSACRCTGSRAPGPADASRSRT